MVRDEPPHPDRFKNAYGVTEAEVADAVAYRFDDLTPWRLMQILCALGVDVDLRIGAVSEPIYGNSYFRIGIDTRGLRRAFGFPHGTYNKDSKDS